MSVLKKGSIIQANENAKDWCGTVLIVDEVREWGVQAFVHIPLQGDAYIRLSNEKFDDLHAMAVMMPGGIEE